MVGEYPDTELVVIRYHPSASNDPFYEPDAVSRMSYYGVSGYPTCIFDGVTWVVGSTNAYTRYRNAIEARKAIPSPLEINVSGTYSSGTDSGTVDVQIVATDPITHSDLFLRYALVESELPYGGHVYHQVLRDMFPSPAGVPISISQGDTLYDSQDFYLEPDWSLLNCEIVVFVQSDSSQEVLQGVSWAVPVDVPNLYYVGNVIYDSLGNDDGRADPGETVEMVVTLGNGEGFQDATGIIATLSTGDPRIDITHATVSYPDVPAGSTGANTGDPFVFSVDPGSPVHRTSFTLDISAQPGNYSVTAEFWMMIGRPEILLVDDDCGETYEIWYQSSLESLAVLFDEWLIQDQGPVGTELLAYPCVIWFTGDDSTATLTSQDATDLAAFLDAGNKLFITGQNIGQDIGADPFYSDYLHANFINPSSGDYMLDGVPGDEIGDGLSILTMGWPGAGNQTSQDVILPSADADSVLVYSPGSTAGVKYAGTYKVVYFGFGFEGIASRPAQGFTHADTVMYRVLYWLDPDFVGCEEGSRSSQTWLKFGFSGNRPNPFDRITEIRYQIPDVGSHLHTSLKVYNAAGSLVRSLADGEQSGGQYSVRWDGKNDVGERLPGGIYFCRLTGGTAAVTSKLILLR